MNRINLPCFPLIQNPTALSLCSALPSDQYLIRPGGVDSRILCNQQYQRYWMPLKLEASGQSLMATELSSALPDYIVVGCRGPAVACMTCKREIAGSSCQLGFNCAAVLCPWTRHFTSLCTPLTQEKMGTQFRNQMVERLVPSAIIGSRDCLLPIEVKYSRNGQVQMTMQRCMCVCVCVGGVIVCSLESSPGLDTRFDYNVDL